MDGKNLSPGDDGESGFMGGIHEIGNGHVIVYMKLGMATPPTTTLLHFDETKCKMLPGVLFIYNLP